MTAAAPAESLRVRVLNDLPPNGAGDCVLYWMVAARRASWNSALDRAVQWAIHLGRPLLVLEVLRCDERWASDRFHRFVIDGMRDNRRAFGTAGIGYYPYVEPAPDAADALFAALASRAAVVVTDRAPMLDRPSRVTAATPHVRVRYEAVDGNGILPLDAPPSGMVFPTAYAFRRFLQRALPAYLDERPRRLVRMPAGLSVPPAIDPDVERRWPRTDLAPLAQGGSLSSLPIDHNVTPVAVEGGESAARRRLDRFIGHDLARYAGRNQPDEDGGSHLSPHLHFGHISAHEVVARLLEAEGWTPAKLGPRASGARQRWWGVSPAAEGFLDQVVTWRELGFNMCDRRPDHDQFESLPSWALRTLDTHASDRREHTYTLDEFAGATTHDPLWNAAQRQLVREGAIHSYLRMLWGKKILEWSATPRDALATMIELNNRYALDGRDPNSYSGIFWVLGRYDRPWAPERPVFGTVRYMSSANTARKLRVKGYLQRYAPSPA